MGNPRRDGGRREGRLTLSHAELLTMANQSSENEDEFVSDFEDTDCSDTENVLNESAENSDSSAVGIVGNKEFAKLCELAGVVHKGETVTFRIKEEVKNMFLIARYLDRNSFYKK